MNDTRRQCQQVANGWRGQLNIVVDKIVKPQRSRRLVLDFTVIFLMLNYVCVMRF